MTGASAILMLAWGNFWLGTVTTTCTMCDTDSTWFSAVTSTPLYLIGVLALLWKPRHPAAVLAGFPLLPFRAWQAWIACRII